MSDFTPLGALIDEARQKHTARQSVAVAEPVEQIDPPSFCVHCDAAAGECDHTGPRYHDSWLELQTAPGSGKILPQYEAWFQRNEHGFDNEGQTREAPKPRPLDVIQRELVPWIFLNERLTARLTEAYERNPHQVSLLSAELRRSLEAGRIENPSGTLYNELGKIREA